MLIIVLGAPGPLFLHGPPESSSMTMSEGKDGWHKCKCFRISDENY